MTDFRLYNTLTRQVEAFAPSDGTTVRMYTCGPTVYNPAHLGNFRTFLFEDLMRRVFALRGWTVRQVMNLTDVDDKIIKRAREQGKTITEVTEPVIVTRGVAYQAEDGSVYFAIAKFPGYGRLSRLDTREVKSGARVLQDDYTKENAQDFALWKAAKEEDEATGAAWDSPWGRGRPGWHLECSAMAMQLLGETLDVHCGGIDLIFPHHEDEIAQSEAATGKTFSRVWLHGAFLLTDGAKMAKRVGNVFTVAGLREANISAAAVRHFVFNTHYRKELNLSDQALEASTEAVRRVGDFARRLGDTATLELGGTVGLARVADEALRKVKEALYDDLNAPEALAALFDFIRQANAELDRKGGDRESVERARAAFDRIDQVLDIVPDAVEADPDLTEWIESRLAERRQARMRRDFAESDRIRDELKARGVVLEDAGGETRWKLG
jgi:cysteinyl-tRNA synthetase